MNFKVVPYRPVNPERKQREEDREQGFSSDSDVVAVFVLGCGV